jgi:glutamate--cysteine ligase regulatory subunit
MNSSREIIISTGNILALNKSVFKKGSEAAAEELFETLKSCLENKKELVDSYSDEKSFEILQENGNDFKEDRLELKISLKIFLYSLNKDDLKTSIERGLQTTNADYMDTLVISFAGQSDTTRLTLDMMKTAWSVLEEFANIGKAKMIGVCDVDTQLFIQLYSWATVKPNIVQINLASCCVVPPELSEFCKQQSIQLLTHSDPLNILPEDKLQQLMKQFESGIPEEIPKPHDWEVKWILRYQVHVKSRGVLSNKGYVAAIGCAEPAM